MTAAEVVYSGGSSIRLGAGSGRQDAAPLMCRVAA